MKMRNIQAYPIADVPDELVEECKKAGQEIAEMIVKTQGHKHPNILLGAINFAHAATLKWLISNDEEQIEKATKLAAVGLIKNVNFLIELHREGKIK